MEESQGASGAAGVPGRGIARDIRIYPVAAVLAFLVLLIYRQVGGFGFVILDDFFYVSENPVVLRGLTADGLAWAFSAFHVENWHPLTWLSHMLDVELFGPSAGWHHRVNVLFHLLNAELLFFVLWRMTGGLWRSALVAALFGVHPLHVESVAWIAERKDVLSTLFWILSMGAYLRYVRRPGAVRYLVVVAMFCLGLLSKPMPVTLPFVLLLLDWWPLGRTGTPGAPLSPSWPTVLRLVREKAPLFLLSAASCAVTWLAQAGGGAAASLGTLPLASRIANAFVSYAAYLGKTVWPSSLAVYYPHPGLGHAGVPAWEIAGSIALLGGLTAAALWQRRRRPGLAAGWFWYLGTLVPVIGLVQVGAQAHADRYTYVPLIGIFVAVAWGIPRAFTRRPPGRLAAGALAGLSVAALAAAGWVQAGYWRDSITLLSRTVTVTDRNWFALNNLGIAYGRVGRYREAIDYLGEAQRIAPNFAKGWNDLGLYLNRVGRHQPAAAALREALRIRPAYPEALTNLGVSANGLGRYEEGIGYFRQALSIRPGDAEAWDNLGVSYAGLGRDRQAVDCFREALRLGPRNAKALNNLGAAYARLGQHERAVECFRETLRIVPGSAQVLNNLGLSYAALGRYREAVECFVDALRIRPDYAEASGNLAAARAKALTSR